MTIEIKILNQNTESDYERLLYETPAAMFNYSLQYRSFLRRILKDADDLYLLAYENNELKAAFPLFMKYGPLGTVVNSLPFYGSHGGVIAKPSSSDAIRESLIQAFYDVCKQQNAICSTIIESPIDPQRTRNKMYSPDFVDERIGQITTLPSVNNEQEAEEALFALYHQKTRNMIRKGIKSGFTVSHDSSIESIKALYFLHNENIQAIGGIAKPWDVFKAIKEVFSYNADYRIYTAKKDGVIVSALLVFYFKGIVEYFTPATLESYRSQQPLSLLIYTAMRDAIVERGAMRWNWGGTWLTQKGVYQFKSRWGTTDYPYRYHVNLYQETKIIQGLSKEGLLENYQYFYTVPFSVLN
ncbi:GNAT family N-acetyltransferase [Methylomarinum vadi]|uniref:GNAT family N-acetyltransferase n=1 Tax=Methylomarinum vadi TaxID=438855 RepID=UPI0004DF2181|nr:GNAT family N-acetyltransferase [Methylomarinum vadi]